MKVPIIEERTILRLIQRRLQRGLARNSSEMSVEIPSQSIGVGLIGAGNVARWKYLPSLKQSHSPFRLKAVFEVDTTAARKVADSFSVPACTSLAELVGRDDVEAVFVCTPTALHCDAALAALKARKHVICEKPLGQSRADARRMWVATREAGTANMVHFSYRFRPDFAYIAQLIDGGVLGRIQHVWGSLSQGQWYAEDGQPAALRGDAAPWKYGPDGGVLRDLGPHLLDLCRWWLGEIRLVHAWTKGVLPGAPTDAACGLSLECQNGAVAHLITSRLATGVKEQTFLDVSGSRGALRLEEGRLRIWTQDVPRWRDVIIPAAAPDFLSTFYSAIVGKPVDLPTFWDGLQNNEALDAALESAQSGKTIDLSAASRPPVETPKREEISAESLRSRAAIRSSDVVASSP